MIGKKRLILWLGVLLSVCVVIFAKDCAGAENIASAEPPASAAGGVGHLEEFSEAEIEIVSLLCDNMDVVYDWLEGCSPDDPNIENVDVTEREDYTIYGIRGASEWTCFATVQPEEYYRLTLQWSPFNYQTNGEDVQASTLLIYNDHMFMCVTVTGCGMEESRRKCFAIIEEIVLDSLEIDTVDERIGCCGVS